LNALVLALRIVSLLARRAIAYFFLLVKKIFRSRARSRVETERGRVGSRALADDNAVTRELAVVRCALMAGAESASTSAG
jgi:hypothetical protein